MTASEFLGKNSSFYHRALIHIAWLVEPRGASSVRHLVFCMIEAYPKELTTLLPFPEQGRHFKGGRLYYQRVVLPFSDAVDFYRGVKENGVVPMLWDESGALNTPAPYGAARQICCGSMQDVRAWPNFILSTKKHDNINPYIADIWDGVRTHQMLPAGQDEYTMYFMSHEGVGEWLEQYLTWNISYYPELVGSAIFVLPNPYYRSCNMQLIPTRSEDVCADLPDRVKIDIQCRHGIDTSGLVVVPFEKAFFGLAGGKQIPIINNSCTVELTGRAEEFGMYVVDAEGELIDYNDFSGFIRKIEIEYSVGGARKKIKRPDDGKTDIVPIYDSFTSVIGEDEEEYPLGERLMEADVRRRRKAEANRMGVKFFYQDHDGAEAYIRELISKARKSVTIVDPYWATNELFIYAMSVTVSKT